MVLILDDVNELTYKAVEPLAPFGVGNPKPLFEFKDVMPVSVRRFGKKSEHLEIMYQNSKGQSIKAIQFFVTNETETKAKEKHTLLAHLEKSYFGGKTELRLRIQEVK
jgi:single-stranded-DNA-specific exonuclease